MILIDGTCIHLHKFVPEPPPQLKNTSLRPIRHYAKHHGLDKETLVFSFTEELQSEDTPESVHMQVNRFRFRCMYVYVHVVWFWWVGGITCMYT